MTEPSVRVVSANGIEFTCLEAGSGPLALCLHGYPDSPHTWRHLLPELAAAGFHAVAPFMRGYAPTGLAPDGCYQSGVLGLDAAALHEALGGGGDAVLIGHDWGALAAYAAATVAPERWRRVVTMAVAPGPVSAAGIFDYDQLKKSWYMFFQLNPLSDGVVAADGHRYIARLWEDWSPGYDATADVAHFVDCVPTAAHLAATLDYYRQTLQFELQRPEHAMAQAAAYAVPPQPLLYLHGDRDGCMGAELAAQTPPHLTVAGSRFELVAGVGHFLHLERPEVVDPLVLEFVTA